MRRNIMALVSAVLALLLLGSSVAAAATHPATGVGGTLFASPVPPPPPGCSRYHLVRFGETLYSIGRLYGVSAWAIAAANHLANPNRIHAGQWLCIPKGGPIQPPPGCSRFHVVARGQTLYSIGRLYGVSPWVIASANGIYNVNRIYVGQRLFIPCRPY